MQALAINVAIAVALRQFLANKVDKIWSLALIYAERRQAQRRCFRLVRLLARDGVGFHHGVQHNVSACDGALWVAVGRQAAGSLNHPGQQRALRQRQVANIFAEIGLRRFSESIE